MEFCQDQSRLPGCQAPVPPELKSERLCVMHFVQTVEHACTDMRCEAAGGLASAARQLEMAQYIQGTAAKLSLVTTGSLRLPDEMKKRVLTTLLTLMVLRESLDRCTSPYSTELRAPLHSDVSANLGTATSRWVRSPI
jgi:hypothetical protein